ncbi:hypothetical protein JL720_7007 [Aureococcus anophagefferens]|nr:hypothetical protein JL720_7007 [Aureococcus anophagefferens]
MIRSRNLRLAAEIAHKEEWAEESPMSAGDTVGCMLDLDGREIRFSVNGECNKFVFRSISVDSAYYPAMSMQAGVVDVNFGERALKFLPEGYTPVAEEQKKQMRAQNKQMRAEIEAMDTEIEALDTHPHRGAEANDETLLGRKAKYDAATAASEASMKIIEDRIDDLGTILRNPDPSGALYVLGLLDKLDEAARGGGEAAALSHQDPRRFPLASRSNVVVADRRQTAMRKPVGDGRIVLAGAWGAKEEQLRTLEKENRDLAERCARAEAAELQSRKDRAKWRSEAAAHEAARRADAGMAGAMEVERLLRLEQLREREELWRMASEDCALRRGESKDAKRSWTAASRDLAAKAQALEASTRTLAAADAENAKLTDRVHRAETRLARVEKALECEARAKEVLAHAKAQKEKHVCVLLKERDRLQAAHRSALHRLAKLGVAEDAPRQKPPVRVVSRTPPRTAAAPAVVSPEEATSVLALDVALPSTGGARAIRKLREREERHATELAVAQHQLRKATEKATALQVRFANKQARDAAERIFRQPFSG